MISLLWILAAALAVFLPLITLVQLFYLESLRLRTRELPSLEYFKETLAGKLNLELEKGTLAFSIIKHSTMVVLSFIIAGISLHGKQFEWTSLLEAAAVSITLMLLCTYLVPQLLYRKTNAHWLLPLTPFLKVLQLTVKPLTSFFYFLQSLAALSGNAKEATENGSTQQVELDALIEAGAGEGLIEEADRRLIHSVVAFGDKTVREVMTARPNMLVIQQDASIEDLRLLAVENRFSRIPVYEDSIDNIIGFVHVRDILALDQDEQTSRIVKEFVRPIQFVPETKPVDSLIREMQQDNVHMAIVVDEYGDTAGLATMEDVVEEVFGEIRDEYDPTADIKQESEDTFIISGNTDLDHLYDLLGYRPGEETESTTIGGLVTEWLGHVPEVGEVSERDGIRIEVTAGDERRVEQVRVSKSEPAGQMQDES